MKNRGRSFFNIIGLVLFTIVVLVAMRLRPDLTPGDGTQKFPSAANQTLQSYPPPENLLPAYPSTNAASLLTLPETSSDPYPDVPQTQTIMRPDPCAKAGSWAEYVDENAKFSFLYPEESELHESRDMDGNTHVSLDLHPDCYVNEPVGTNRVVVGVLSNRDKLSIEDFIVLRFTQTSETVGLAKDLKKVTKTVSVNGVMAFLMEGKITRETPQVYIPYNDLVILVGIFETRHMPPFGPATPGTLDLFYKILHSIKFLDL